MDAKRRRNGTSLAVAGLAMSVAGLVALTVTDPVTSRDAGEPRVWAVTCTFVAFGLLVAGLVMRKSPAPPPPTKTHAYWFVLAGVGLALLVRTEVSQGSADWTLYVPGGYLVVASLGSWLYEYVSVRRRRGDRELRGEEESG